jgi:hypothetical protein
LDNGNISLEAAVQHVMQLLAALGDKYVVMVFVGQPLYVGMVLLMSVKEKNVMWGFFPALPEQPAPLVNVYQLFPIVEMGSLKQGKRVM